MNLVKKHFEPIYKNQLEPERKTMQRENRQPRKTRVFVTPEVFDKIIATLEMGGGIERIMEVTGVSRPTAENYLDIARKKMVERQTKARDEANVRQEKAVLEIEVESLKEKLELSNAKYMQEFQKMKTDYDKKLGQYQETVNKLTIEKSKLEAKVEVMTDLLRAK
jgi:hypothetical protein